MNTEFRKATCDRAVADKLPAFNARANDGRMLSASRKPTGWLLSIEGPHAYAPPADGESAGRWSLKSQGEARADVSDGGLAKAVEEMCS